MASRRRYSNKSKKHLPKRSMKQKKQKKQKKQRRTRRKLKGG